MALTLPQTDYLETVVCNLCGSDDSQELYPSNLNPVSTRDDRLRCTDSALGQHGRIVQCRQCGLAYTNPREPASEVLEAYGQVDDPTYVAEEYGRVKTFEGSLRLLHRYRRAPGRLLDVGCYTGLFLHIARQQGWQVTGLEPSRWACETASKQYQVQVHQGTLADFAGSEEKFDVVTMWDVLEHYTDPLGELQQAHQFMAPNGIIALTTIDMGSLIAQLLGGRWWWFMEMHLYYFTRRTVTALLKRAGFEVVVIHAHVRMISLRYLWTRLEALGGSPARFLAWAGERLNVNHQSIPVVLGDLMTVIARRA